MIPRFVEKAFGSDGTRSLGIFGATVILNGAISLFTIPIVVAVVGADAWASMATGQSVGASLAAVVLFGWGLTGPATVAMTALDKRPGLFLDSLIARAYLLLPLLIIQAAVTFAIVPQEKVVALVSGTAMLLAGVSANWFFTGEGRSGRFLLFDTIPRVGGTVLGLLLVVTTGQLMFFALAQLTGSTVALVASAIVILRGKQLDFRSAMRWNRVAASLASQRHGVVATGLNAAFMPAVLGIVAVASPALLPVFVLANRLTSFIGMALSPMFLLFQGWVPASRGHELARRIRLSASITAVAALFSGILCAALLPTFGVVLTHGQVVVETWMAITFGVLAIVQTGSPYLSNVGLMSVGQVRVIARSTAVGLPLAIVFFVIIELLGGAQVAAWGLIAGGSIAAVWQILALNRAVALLPDDAESDPIPAPSELSPARP